MTSDGVDIAAAEHDKTIVDDDDGEPEVITKVRVFLGTLDAKRASASDYVDQYEKRVKKISSLVKSASSLENKITSNRVKIEQLKVILKSYKKQNEVTMKRLQVTRNDLEDERRLLSNLIEKPFEDKGMANVDEVIATVARTLKEQADWKDVYNSKKVCTVCNEKRRGWQMVKMNNCSHEFCKPCVQRSTNKASCMECRAFVGGYFMIKKESKRSERYRIKCYDYNFWTATLISNKQNEVAGLDTTSVSVPVHRYLADGIHDPEVILSQRRR